MESANKFDEEMIVQEWDDYYHLIHAYINQTGATNTWTKTYYENTLVDFYLYHGKAWHELSVQTCNQYIEYLDRVYRYRNNSEQFLKKKVKLILKFLKFVQQKENGPKFRNELEDHPIVQRLFRPKKKVKRRKLAPIKKVEALPKIIENYFNYLVINNYRVIEIRKQIKMFQQFLKNQGIEIDIFLEDEKEKLLFEKIRGYENVLSKRVVEEEIQTSSATTYLRAVQLFVKYLFSENLVSRLYTIPLHLRGKAKRSNEYVPKEAIISLMNTIQETSNLTLRDLSIFLIIVDTGCRPKEVANLTVEDVDFIERTMSFECKKTEKRKVKISPEVFEIIRGYFDVRGNYNPTSNSFFLKFDGCPITTSTINTIFYLANINTFQESRYPAKAFRHTYITNALEDYSFEKVSNSIGHKDYKSTYYYYYRSNKRLLNHALGHSPLKLEGGKIYANTKTN